MADPSERGTANVTLLDPYTPGDPLPSARGTVNVTLLDPYVPGDPLPSARGITSTTVYPITGLHEYRMGVWNGTEWEVHFFGVAVWDGVSWQPFTEN